MGRKHGRTYVNESPGCGLSSRGIFLNVEQEIDDVAVCHDVLFSFAAKKTLRLRVGKRAARLEIVEGDDLGADKAALKIGVDFACRLGRFGAVFDGLGAALIGASREEGNKTQQTVAARNQPVQTRFLQAEFFHEHRLFLGVVQLGDVRL